MNVRDLITALLDCDPDMEVHLGTIDSITRMDDTTLCLGSIDGMYDEITEVQDDYGENYIVLHRYARVGGDGSDIIPFKDLQDNG